MSLPGERWRWLAALLLLPAFAAPVANAVEEPGPVLRSIGALADPLNGELPETVALRGVVTLVRKKAVYVQDQTGAMAGVTQDQARLAIGDEVELQGRCERRGPAPVLYVTAVRKLWSGSPPVPVSLRPEQAAEGSFRGRLIDIEGRLLQKRVSDGFLRLTLEGAGQIFGATLELSSPVGGNSQLARNLEENSVLRLVGVCAPSQTQDPGESAFAVLLRSTDDIRTIQPPPWWNLRHAIWLAGLAVVLLSIFYRIRHRSLNMRFQAIVEERSRIAREMHDTLAQGFSGVTYQLEGLSRELDASVERESIERHLSMALKLVRHCREDAHRSIFALRSLAQSDPNLLELLVSSCSSLRARSDVQIVTATEGKPVQIPDDMLNHLLRIGQEAITNALQHSGATEIRVVTKFDDCGITLEVSDNGAGFEVVSADSVELGRFGITGMKERAKYIQGTLSIKSEHGKGTVISIHAPIARKNGWSWSAVRVPSNGAGSQL